MFFIKIYLTYNTINLIGVHADLMYLYTWSGRSKAYLSVVGRVII